VQCVKFCQEQFKKVTLKELGVGFVEMFWVYEINKQEKQKER